MRALRGTLSTVGMLLVASVVVFAMIRSAPGDPVDVQLGESGGVSLSQADEDRIRAERLAELGLDRPLPEQYARWLVRMVSGDWGTSYRTGQPVLDEMLDRLPASLALGAAGFGVAVALAGGLALLASRRPGAPVDQLVRLATLMTVAVPSFLLGTLALQIATGTTGYRIAGPASTDRIWLPALVLGIAITPTMSRVLRASLVAERGRLYAVAALARGASPSRTLLRHVLRPAVGPVMILGGLAFASLVTGSIITEAVFTWPGVGLFAVDAIAAQDYPVVQAYVVLATALVVLVNRGVDLAGRLVDPRQDARAEAVA
ncbi:peptide/nickel transport system permease protein [Pseudonocardia hierapolitana]|uniref:Peptide/nickel transport system permease protein n=1 Tax=Pseudonocardia hierapolitana TaxID=1128676 RepID=A0A561SQU8_9PSEU|nr:ABC transporter permease [Pseudonocardia hierapolitana]TWF77221.1 peptide/nickel transport system permease protein [Pseudonocardia hierapolitana]